MSPDTPITILHLEDNPLDAELTEELLHSSGVNCRLLRIMGKDDFRRCLQDFSNSPAFDLILADYNMPGFDGLAALHMTREVDKDVPFILLSGALGEELAVELLRTGATDYVLKHNIHRLPPVVKRAINEYEGKLRERKSQDEAKRARDEAEKANAAKSHFLGRMSHELRTPMNAIIGYTQLMQSDPMTEEQEHCAKQILKAGEHLLQLINEVLDITRIESGVIPITIKGNSLVPIMELAVDLVRPMARDANVTILTDGGPCDIQVLVDKDRLTQALINLITNAIKYNHREGVVFVECTREREGYVKILIRDTGIGIPPNKMERLFTPFDRLDIEAQTAIPGTGLGLTVTKALVDALGGTLGIVSSENEGTLFWIEVPEYNAEDTPSAPDPGESAEAVEAATPSGSYSILLVEAHAPTADFMLRVFKRRRNFEIRHVKTLFEAKSLLSAGTFDMVLTDSNMPDDNVESLLRFIVETPNHAQIPVIMLTSSICEDPKPDYPNLSCISKPIKITNLFAEINKCMREANERT